MAQAIDQIAVSRSVSAATAAAGDLPAGPTSRDRVVRRAATALARVGQRFAVVARRVGQPADTVTDRFSPEETRWNFLHRMHGGEDIPASRRGSDRNW